MKRTPEREARILQALRAGNTRKAAAAYGGIDESTLWRWAQQSATFANALTRAEADSEVGLVAIIRQAAPQDWRAAMALLERRFPDDWAKREKVDLEVFVRQRARELGLDEDRAIEELKPRLRLATG